MHVDIDKLVKVSTYARNTKKSVTWINRLIKEGKLATIKIDEMTFIKL